MIKLKLLILTVIYISLNGNASAKRNLQLNKFASNQQQRAWIGLAHMQFTLDLLNSFIMTQNYNPATKLMKSLLFSPFSIQSVLMMMHLGAKGQTKSEIAAVLRLPNLENNVTFSIIHEIFGQSVKSLLEDENVGKSLSAANRVFVQENLQVAPTYTLALSHYHNSELVPINFVGESSKIVTAINDWIKKQTHGQLQNFLTAPPSPATHLMAINALFYKGDWQYKFDPSDTQPNAWFRLSNGQTAQVPMMVGQMPLAFAYSSELQTSIIEMPYRLQRLGLFAILPDETNGLFSLLRKLNATSFSSLITSMRKVGNGGVNVRFPKFSISSMPRVTQVLRNQLGLNLLFSNEQADLSGMFMRSVPIHVDELLHKSVLKIDEMGSVGAAASATVVERVGVVSGPYFEADHPFIFFIIDKQTGLILFAGVYAGPKDK